MGSGGTGTGGDRTYPGGLILHGGYALRASKVKSCCGGVGYGDRIIRGDEPNEMGDNLLFIDFGTGRSVMALSDGMAGLCAILDDGSFKCMGADFLIGDGTGRSYGDDPNEMGDNLPRVNLGVGRTAQQVSVGLDHACAVLTGGSVKCWGYNGQAQLGLGDYNPRGLQPGQLGDALPQVNLGTGRTAKRVAAGLSATCAILDNNNLKCWGALMPSGLAVTGDNIPIVDFGGGRYATQVGINQDLTGGAAPVPAKACALLIDGSVKCWNRTSPMGDSLPAIPLGRPAKQLSMGYYHQCVVLDDGSLKCWGDNRFGQLGLGSTVSPPLDNIPTVNLGPGRTAKQVWANYLKTCALLDDDRLKCWGRNGGGLGIGDKEDRCDNSWETIEGLPAVDFGTF
jgi:alpha-tubulin suppressor-like RCC1 family protein